MSEIKTVTPPGVRDVRMVERAMRERWPMTADVRKAMTKQLMLIVVGRDAKGQPRTVSDRARTSAFRALIAADAINLNAEKEVLPQQHVHFHEGIDFDKIPLDELKHIEAKLLALASEHATEDTGVSVPS